jgi:hypothetical protein
MSLVFEEAIVKWKESEMLFLQTRGNQVFDYSDAQKIHKNLCIGISNGESSKILLDRLTLQEGGGGDLLSQLSKVAQYMSEEIINELSELYKKEGILVKTGMVGYKIEEFLLTEVPAYKEYITQAASLYDANINYKSSPYWREVIEQQIKQCETLVKLINEQEGQFHSKYVYLPITQGRVTDVIGVFTNEQKSDLEMLIKNIEAQKSIQIAVLIIYTTGSETIDDYSLRIANKWGLGEKDVNNGILFTLAYEDRKVRIELGKGIDDYISDEYCRKLLDYEIIPYFKKGDYYRGMKIGIIRIAEAIQTINQKQEQARQNVSTNDIVYKEAQRELSPIRAGNLTTGVTNPEKAFDGIFNIDDYWNDNFSRLPWYWGEAGRYHFLHFKCNIGNDKNLSFRIISMGNPGSYLTIDGLLRSTIDSWVEITRVPLPQKYPTTETASIVTIMNTEDYVTGGVINLRVRWMNGDSSWDALISEIWRVPSQK